MNQLLTKGALLTLRLAFVLAVIASPASAQQVITGSMADGSLYEFDVPATWNGDRVVYAHGIWWQIPRRSPAETM